MMYIINQGQIRIDITYCMASVSSPKSIQVHRTLLYSGTNHSIKFFAVHFIVAYQDIFMLCIFENEIYSFKLCCTPSFQ
jgi:hypothetical protein